MIYQEQRWQTGRDQNGTERDGTKWDGTGRGKHQICEFILKQNSRKHKGILQFSKN